MYNNGNYNQSGLPSQFRPTGYNGQNNLPQSNLNQALNPSNLNNPRPTKALTQESHLTELEKHIFLKLFNFFAKGGPTIVPSLELTEFLTSSNLTKEALAKVWKESVVNKGKIITKEEFFTMLRRIALYQNRTPLGEHEKFITSNQFFQLLEYTEPKGLNSVPFQQVPGNYGQQQQMQRPTQQPFLSQPYQPAPSNVQQNVWQSSQISQYTPPVQSSMMPGNQQFQSVLMSSAQQPANIGNQNFLPTNPGEGRFTNINPPTPAPVVEEQFPEIGERELNEYEDIVMKVR